jgi:glycolate oxidase iron-sulfur subunit
MQTNLAPEFQGTPEGQAAEDILRRCVHCGFCTATCPTYQLLGDELDGPRGRIYLMKQVLEGETPTRATQEHLDRCLTCRNCESTCPSGVQYGQLLEIGRDIVEAKVERPRNERIERWLLKEGLTSPLFKPAIKLGQLVRPLLPAVLKDKVPARAPRSAHDWPQRVHKRKVGLLLGCVQPTLAPNINSATARVLDAAGIQTLVADDAGCCGAIRSHLSDHEGGLADMRRNVDAWWPLIQQGHIEALVMNASGCGVTVREYGRALAHDPLYAERAAKISAMTRDVSELLPDLVPKLKGRLKKALPKLAYHPPCTLQHGQQLRGGVEAGLRELGFELNLPTQDSHLCCGSAGTYSVLQPTLSKQLRDQKLATIAPLHADAIVTGNIGCMQQLQSGTATPVRHWIEVLDELI